MSTGGEDRATIAQARREYITAELDTLALAADPELLSLLLEELEFALFPRVHEGRIPTYGSIITRNSDIRAYDMDHKVVINLGDLALNREAADGLSTFVWRSPSVGTSPGDAVSGVICFTLPRFLDELSISTVREKVLVARLGNNKPPENVEDFLVVQRAMGKVRILCANGIIEVDNNLWARHPYLYDFKLDELVEKIWPEEKELPGIAWSISRVAVQLLSPAHIGATIVWTIRPCPESLFERSNEIRFPSGEGDLRIRRSRSEHWALANILSQRDGAVLINAEGIVQAANIFLKPQAAANGRPSDGGTRQWTAREASKEIDGVIVTVSSDGPVRAFYRGRRCLSTVEPNEPTHS